MRVLVTGGAGFIGSHLVDALVDRGDEVIVLDNLRRGSREHLQPHLADGACDLQVGDIRDRGAVDRALEGVALVFHLAAQSNVLGAMSDLDYSFTTNVAGTFNVLDASQRAGVRRLVFSSSREVYGDPEVTPVLESAPFAPKNPYGASKVAGEAYCQAMKHSFGLDVAVLRFANVYGTRDSDRVIPRWLRLAETGADLPVYGGKQVLDFVPVRVAVAALLHAGDCGLDGVLNVGTGVGTEILELAERIRAATGSGVSVRIEPANDCEVTRFVADVTRMRGLGIEPPDDPLVDLKAMAAVPVVAT
jgi:UDP-glucose 4-epimerase